jgi:hypothetical protein
VRTNILIAQPVRSSKSWLTAIAGEQGGQAPDPGDVDAQTCSRPWTSTPITVRLTPADDARNVDRPRPPSATTRADGAVTHLPGVSCRATRKTCRSSIPQSN